MKKKIASLALALTLPVSVMAGDDPREDMIEARQSIMHLYGFSMGTLGAMAKGKIEYDADKASEAAKNLHIATQLSQNSMWAKGTDNSIEDLKDITKAKPDGWAQYEKLAVIGEKFSVAAEKLAAEAGNGLGALRANIGGVGKACKGCHDISKAK